MMEHPTLLVFSDDWGRHPSSCQHLIGKLLPKYQVTWVNTIGMRPPRFDAATWRRGMEKLGQWIRVGRNGDSQHAGPKVLRPIMWPWIGEGRGRSLNGMLLASQLGKWLQRQVQPVVAITTIPIVADLMDRLPVRRWIYYCVDDFSKWPGLAHESLAAMEAEVVEKADVVIAAGEELRRRLAVVRDEVELLTHGVDLDHWKAKGRDEPLGVLADLPRPLVLFWGLVDRRMDVAALRALSDSMPEGTIVLVGPEQDPDPAIRAIPRVRRVPAVPFDQLPGIAHASNVLIMPYADLPVTRFIQPLKLLEYLATGRPVVVQNLPATRAWADCLDLATGPDEFAEKVLERIRGGVPSSQVQARQRLESESWQSKARSLEQYFWGPAARSKAACAT